MNQPLVSVLMPSYNKAPYIGEAIESVLCQTYRNLELIVVDDASTDGSWEIIQAYQKRFPYTIKAVQQPHSGGCAARNKAFALSSGKYIQYLDADDILNPEKIAAQMNVFTGTGEEDYVANGKWARFYTSDYRKENLSWGPHPSVQRDLSAIEWLLISHMSTPASWLTPCKLIKKAGPWDESLVINQDGEFFSRVVAQAKLVKFVPGSIVYYRSNVPNSVSRNTVHSEAACSILKTINELEKIFTIYNVQEKARHLLSLKYLGFAFQYWMHDPDLVKTIFPKIGALSEISDLPGTPLQNMLVRTLGLKAGLRLHALAKRLVRRK